jgi:hypothetical protein
MKGNRQTTGTSRGAEGKPLAMSCSTGGKAGWSLARV